MSSQVSIQDRCAIVGIAETKFAKNLEGSEKKLAVQVIRDALEDAGIDPSEVDGLSSYTMETTAEVEIAKNLGMGDISFFSQIAYGGGGGCATIGHLAMAIATGQANVGVAWRSRKRGSGPRPWSAANVGLPTPLEWTRPFGLLRPADEIGILTRRYMYEFGATRDHLANVALACRKHANMNPRAMMYERTMTRDDYMNSRWISEPLCLFDNCLETDGALAAVIVSSERAKDCKNPPVFIHSFGQGFRKESHTMVNYWCEDPMMGPAFACANQLWKNSEIQPDDIDVAQIYDAFTTLIPLSLEGYGFCKRGEGASFTENGAIELGGRLPINTSGGGLSEAYVHGFNLINEGVRQMRGTSTAQVPQAKSCLVTSGEGVPTSAVVFRRD